MSAIAVVGKSGTGKSTSYGEIPQFNIKGLPPEKTAVVNVSGKDLPFKGWKTKYKGDISEGGNYLKTSNPKSIANAIKYIHTSRKDLENIVIDDAQYIMAFEFLARNKEVGYGKFADLGVNMSEIIKAARITDKKVFFLWHPELDEQSGYKMKTVGKMVDNYLTLEGLFTVVLYTDVNRENETMEYRFVTNHDGQYPAKSPVGMFDLYIPNDLGYVVNKIDEYNKG